jgi:ADP-ribosylglycohydrolase
MNQKPNDRYSAAFGCFLGACIGDATGAVLEFIGHKPSLTEVKHAMTMPNSQIFGLAEGQVTDDCELALCLAQALADSEKFDLEKIARNYARWIESRPFDIGFTTMKTLGCVKNPEQRAECERLGYAVVMNRIAQQCCMDSKANGSLMRCAPLGIWGSQLPPEKLADYAIADSRLSHANESCCHAVACYVIAIASLIENLGDNVKAFKQAVNWANQHACQEVRRWLQQAKENVDVPYHPQAGFIKIAFVHAFRHLLLDTPFQEALQETLYGGGDTDTNACIVGGLMGARWGAEQLPDEMKTAVLHCDTRRGQPRPDFLHTTQLPKLTERLLALKRN